MAVHPYPFLSGLIYLMGVRLTGDKETLDNYGTRYANISWDLLSRSVTHYTHEVQHISGILFGRVCKKRIQDPFITNKIRPR